MNIQYNNLQYFIILTGLGLFTSCNSLPPGNPPPEGEPIIREKPAEVSVQETESELKKNKISAVKEPELETDSALVSEQHPAPVKKTHPAPENTVRPEIPDGADAVNYMMIMLATKCPPIASPAGGPPKVLNEFTVADDKVNDFPLQIWNRLINNSMIIPVSSPDDDYSYIISSSIDAADGKTGPDGKHKYTWKMNMLEAKDRKQIWHTVFEFSQ